VRSDGVPMHLRDSKSLRESPSIVLLWWVAKIALLSRGRRLDADENDVRFVNVKTRISAIVAVRDDAVLSEFVENRIRLGLSIEEAVSLILKKACLKRRLARAGSMA